MATNKLPNVVANVTKDSEGLWWDFIQAAKALRLTRTAALELAAAQWLRSNTKPDGTPFRANPFD